MRKKLRGFGGKDTRAYPEKKREGTGRQKKNTQGEKKLDRSTRQSRLFSVLGGTAKAGSGEERRTISGKKEKTSPFLSAENPGGKRQGPALQEKRKNGEVYGSGIQHEGKKKKGELGEAGSSFFFFLPGKKGLAKGAAVARKKEKPEHTVGRGKKGGKPCPSVETSQLQKKKAAARPSISEM